MLRKLKTVFATTYSLLIEECTTIVTDYTLLELKAHVGLKWYRMFTSADSNLVRV